MPDDADERAELLFGRLDAGPDGMDVFGDLTTAGEAAVKARLADAIREGVLAERKRWVDAGTLDPTARRAHEPNPRGVNHYLISGTPEVLAAATRAIAAAHVEGIVGGFVPLPSDQWHAVARRAREECEAIARSYAAHWRAVSDAKEDYARNRAIAALHIAKQICGAGSAPEVKPK